MKESLYHLQSVGVTIDSTPILREITLSLPDSAVTGIIGPNGSGKSTLLRVLAGIVRPTTGSIHYQRKPLASLANRTRAQSIAFVEQESSTTVDDTVYNIVSLGRTPHRGRWPALPNEGQDIIKQALATCDISRLAQRSWQSLSGGERQRTHLARALAQQPRTLLMDEPTNHLDLAHQIRLMRTTRELGMTVVMALHDLDLSAAYCDRIIILDKGTVAAQGNPSDVLTAEQVSRVYGVDSTVEFHHQANRTTVVWHR